MLHLPRVISRASSVALLAATAIAATVLTAAPAQASSNTYTTYERQVVHAINAQRKAHGLKPLSNNGCPDNFSEALAKKLRTRPMKHQSLRPILRRCHASRAGENIARAPKGYTAEQLVQLWMNSPAHRANILDRRFTGIGVGTQCSASCTTVTDFIRR